MNASSEPKRSHDDPARPSALRAALTAARADRPSAESLARVAARLGVASSGASSSGASSSAAPLVQGSAGRLTLVAVAALCLLGGAALHAALTSTVATVAPARELRAPPPIESAAKLDVPPVPLAPVRPHAPEVARPQDDAPSAPRAKALSVSKPRATELDPNAELELLRRAQAALTPAPSRALALCEEHAERFPRGAFQQERELIAVVALANRGELRAAHARAARFRRAYPDSVHAPRLDALLRDHKNGEPDAHTAQPAATRRTRGE